jgi:hypothetical protein
MMPLEGRLEAYDTPVTATVWRLRAINLPFILC